LSLLIARCLTICPNVRRYVALAQSRGGACFCTRGAMQGYAVITLFSCWQKPWHQEGVPGGSRGRPHRRPLNSPLKPESSRGAESQW